MAPMDVFSDDIRVKLCLAIVKIAEVAGFDTVERSVVDQLARVSVDYLSGLCEIYGRNGSEGPGLLLRECKLDDEEIACVLDDISDTDNDMEVGASSNTTTADSAIRLTDDDSQKAFMTNFRIETISEMEDSAEVVAAAVFVEDDVFGVEEMAWVEGPASACRAPDPLDLAKSVVVNLGLDVVAAVKPDCVIKPEVVVDGDVEVVVESILDSVVHTGSQRGKQSRPKFVRPRQQGSSCTVCGQSVADEQLHALKHCFVCGGRCHLKCLKDQPATTSIRWTCERCSLGQRAGKTNDSEMNR